MFNSKSKTSVDLSKKVDNVLNASAELEIAARDEEIKAAQAEKEALENIRKKNETKVFLQN